MPTQGAYMATKKPPAHFRSLPLYALLSSINSSTSPRIEKARQNTVITIDKPDPAYNCFASNGTAGSEGFTR